MQQIALSEVLRVSSKGALLRMGLLAIMVSMLSNDASAEGEQLWFSTNRTPGQIAAEQGKLYAGLYNIDKLPVRKVIDDEGVFPEQIFRQEGIIFGGLGATIESVLCDINPHICSRDRIAALSGIVEDPTKHVGGTVPSKGRWTNKKGSAFYLPDISFEEGINIEFYDKKRGDRIENIVVRDRRGCDQYDGECQNLLYVLNSDQEGYDSIDFAGKIQVPTLALTAVIDLDCREVQRGDQLRDGGFCAGASVSLPVPEEDADHKEIAYPLGDSEKALVRDLGKGHNSLTGMFRAPFGGFKVQSRPPQQVDKEAYYQAHQKTMFARIKFPFITEPVPNKYRKSIRGPTVVGVIDKKVQANHCDLPTGDSLRLFEVRPGDLQRGEEDSTCNDLPRDGHTNIDHGTHVVGLIAGQLNGIGIAGLNPFSSIAVLQIKESSLRDAVYQRDMANQIVKLFQSAARIVNLSIDFDQNEIDAVASNLADSEDTRLIDYINKTKKTVLWVAAAGNDGKNFDTETCNVHPACIQRVNVLPVIGLNEESPNPKISTESNYGGDFYLGAISENIVSTGGKGDYARLSGTSQAAPQVTAIASYLLTWNLSLNPAQIRNRLVACAAPIWDRSRRIYFGLLDAECSLRDPSKDRIEFRNSATPPVFGELKRVTKASQPDNVQSKLTFRTNDDNEVSKEWSRHLYAFHFNQDRQEYTVIWNDKRDGPNGDAEKHHELTLDPNLLDARLHVETEAGKREISISEIKSFVRRIEVE